MRSAICFVLVFFAANTLFAQNYAIKGNVKSGESAAIPTATVSLLKAADSSWVQSVYTGDDGSFSIDSAPAGNYILNVASLNYKTAVQPIALNESKTISIVLQKQSNTLKEVTVTSKKPFIETALGKTIVNVDASVLTSGTNVLDVLKKSPGVAVDAMGNISLQGKKGILVLIDDRQTYLAGDQLADYLKTLSSDDVTQLELITQPSSKYDAEGVAGIINIKTKKGRNEGFNGSATVSYTQGFYPYSTETVLLNYKKKKLNISSTINHINGTSWGGITSHRVFEDPTTQTPIDIMDERADAKEIYSNEQLKLGADYTMSDKLTFGASVTGIYHPNHENSYSTTDINDITNNTLIHSTASTPDHFTRENLLANAYLKYDFDKQTNMTIDANYLDYNKTYYQSSDNKDFDQQGNQVDELYLNGVLPSSVKVYNIKDDFSAVLKKDIKLEAGFKSSLVQNDDDAQYTLLQNNIWVPDTTRSNHFLYNENINALYVDAHKGFGKKWEAQAGLRAEQANVSATQLIGDQHFTTSSLSLFPTAFVGYKMNDKNQFELNFGRRIERPNYQSLNPFIDFVDQYNYSTGNPELKPQFSNYVEAKYSYNNELITSVNVSHVSNMFGNELLTNTATQTTIRTVANTGKANTVGASVSYNKQLYKWWQLSTYGGVYYIVYADSDINEPAHASGTGSYLGADSQFTFGKGWVLEGQYSVNGKMSQSILSTSLPSQSMYIGVSKKVLHDTGTIKVDVSDPFNFYGYSEQFVGDSINAIYNYKWHSRQCGVSFTYNFGKKYDSKQHTSDISDESKRINM